MKIESPSYGHLKLRILICFCLSIFPIVAVRPQSSLSGKEPEARNKAAIVYDEARGRVVMFGGAVGLGPSRRVTGDTWEWDSRSWVKVSAVGPLARAAHALAYDDRRKKIVLFGGEGSHGVLGDTWEWDGKNWKQVAQSGPPARAGHRLAYDSRRKRVVLFGGTGRFGRESLPAYNDTWEWDGREWRQVSSTGPGGRVLFGMAYDSKRGKVVLFGGNTAHRPPFDVGLMADTWEWDGRSWVEVKASGPPKRDHHVMAFDSRRGKIILYGGGAQGPLLGDTWEWDGREWKQVDTVPPTTLGADASAYDNRRNKVVTYGGWDKGPLPDIWEFDGTQWVRVK